MSALKTAIAPFLARPLLEEQLGQLELHLTLLLKWNARISLTAIRDPEEIARRHFGESLFAGEQLRPENGGSLIDFGSGAGFPGLPIATLWPSVAVTLIESQQKKVAFLREVVRTLKLNNVRVHAGRAESSGLKSKIVTLRAVEKFEAALPIAASLVEPGGKVALLIGSAQVEPAMEKLAKLAWQPAIHVPRSRERVLLIGSAAQSLP